MAFLILVLVCGVWKDWSEADLMLGSSRLAGFGPLRTRGTMTTSLCERSHGGHVTQKRLLHDSEHASADPVREKYDTFTHWSFMACHWVGIYTAPGFEVSILIVVDISPYLDGSAQSQGALFRMFTAAFMKCVWCRIKDGLVNILRGCSVSR